MVSRAPDRSTLDSWLERRGDGEPLAWILGTVTFLGIPLRTDPGVYVPRAQTEQLATRSSALLPRRGMAADLCTGSGAVAAYLMRSKPDATVVGTDIDPAAASCALRNGVNATVADLDGPLRPGSFDLVTAVAPYVPREELQFLPADVLRYEPREALDGGPGGTEVLARVVVAAARLLRPGGWLLTEIGGEQDTAVAPLLAGAGFVLGELWRDEDGDLRGCSARFARSAERGPNRLPGTRRLDPAAPGT